ncbi:phage head closure protein [Solibacillus cecembensis]|uniref:phage head closure protein n=1 Tax=Solibacillus cecembensis TaxID=459347 RepID=UPI003D034830
MNYQHNNNSGRMNKRVTFFNPPGEIINGWPSKDWTPYKRVWAEVKTQKGYRVFNSDATQWHGKKILGIRYREDVHAGMRINIGGKMVEGELVGGTMYEMDSPPINDDELNQWLTIILKEVL